MGIYDDEDENDQKSLAMLEEQAALSLDWWKDEYR